MLGLAAIVPLTNMSKQKGFTFLEAEEEGGSQDDDTLDIYSYGVLTILALFFIATFVFAGTYGCKLYSIGKLGKLNERSETILLILTGKSPAIR